MGETVIKRKRNEREISNIAHNMSYPYHGFIGFLSFGPLEEVWYFGTLGYFGNLYLMLLPMLDMSLFNINALFDSNPT